MLNMTSFPKRIVAESKKIEDFTFVQIGAHDGKKHDPIYRFVKKLGWRGLLVEPVPRYFKMLKQNYEGQKRLKFANYAIGDRDGETTIYGVADDAPLWYRQMIRTKDSFERKNVLFDTWWYAPGLNKYIVKKKVKVSTLSSLLKKQSVGHVHMYMIDTEGYDGKIVKQINLKKDPPEYICYEHLLLSEKERAEVWQMLERNGYELVKMGRWNTYAFRQK